MNLLNVYKFIRQKILRIRESIFHGRSDPSPIVCDFWLVCHEKDFECAKLCIQSIKRFSLNPIKQIYFISTTKSRPSWLGHDIKYIYEDEIPGIVEAKKILNKCSYSGWIVQQILKLSGAQYSERFVVVDCDTILLRPHLFYYYGNAVLRLSYEYSPIYRPFERLLGISAWQELSFVCHMMPFEADILRKLQRIIETKTSFKWHEAIAKYSQIHGMVISEWDLYARFLIQSKYSYRIGPWVNETVPKQSNMSLDSLLLKYANNRFSISLHESSGPLVLK